MSHVKVTLLRPRLVAFIAAFAFLILVSVAPSFTSRGDATNSGDGNLLRQVCYLASFVLVITAAPFLGLRQVLAVPSSLMLVVAWCWLSIGWALQPEIALRRMMLTTLVIWTTFMIVRKLGYDLTIVVMRWAFVAVLLANCLVVAVWPSIGIHQAGLSDDLALVGDWRGFTPHKNYAGAMCAFVFLLFALTGRKVLPIWRCGVLLASAVFLLASGSKTSIGVLALSLLAAVLYIRYDVRHRRGLTAGAISLMVVFVILSGTYWDDLLLSFDNPDTLTGRVQIWPMLFAYSREHLFQGSGYGSFWNIGPASPVYAYKTDWVSDISSGHNGYLDLLVQIGLPGLALVVVAVFVKPIVTLLTNATVSRREGALLLALLVFCAGHNLTESSLLDRDALVQVISMFAVALTDALTGTSGAVCRSIRGHGVFGESPG